MSSDIRKQATLVKTIFGGEKGKELLELLEDTNSPSFTSNTNEQYYRIGRADLIRELKYLLNATTNDIKSMEQAGTYDNLDNDF